MKTTLELTSKETGKKYNITFDFSGNRTKYFIDGHREVDARLMMASFELGYTKLAQSKIRKENAGKVLEIKKQLSESGHYVETIATIDGVAISENALSCFASSWKQGSFSISKNYISSGNEWEEIKQAEKAINNGNYSDVFSHKKK